MFQTPLFIFALLFGFSDSTLAESSIEKLQSTAAQSIKEAAGLSQAQIAVSLIQSKFFPDAEGNPPVWRVVSDPNSSDKPRIEATEFNAQGTIVNLASSWGNSDYIVDQSGLAALKKTSSLSDPGLEQDGFIGIPNLSGLASAEKDTYFGSATSRFPASTNAIQKVPITFKSLSTGTGALALLNVQVGSMNVEIPVPINSSGLWYQEAYIKAVNAGADDLFGYSNSISGDTIIVGAYEEDSNQTTITNGATASSNNSNSNSGAAYVFKRTGSVWAQEAYLKASNAGNGDQLGISLGISGDTIVVGAYGESSNQTTITNAASVSSDSSLLGSGAAYVFKRANSTWAQEAYLKASNAGADDVFGYLSRISGDTIVIGSQREDSSQTNITNGATASSNNTSTDSGAAYVFKRAGSVWAQEAYLKASNNDAGDLFGVAVSISGDTIVVGSYGEYSNQTSITNGTTASSNNSNSNSGAAYVFKRTGSTWAQEAYLKAPNSNANDRFGNSVDVSDDTIVIGAWLEDSSQTTITNGTTASSNNSNSNSGAAYVFKRTGSTWAQEAYLKASNAGASDFVGFPSAISGDTIVLGAHGESSSQTTITNGQSASSDNSKSRSGAVYVFRRREVESTPSISSVTPSTAFCPGNSIIIFGSGFMKDATVKVGDQPCLSKTTQGPNEIVCELPRQPVAIPGDLLNITVTNPNGSVSTLDDSFSCDGWYQEAYIKAPNAGAGDRFGEGISLSEDTLVVGAPRESSNQTTVTNGTTGSADNSKASSGAAYIFSRNGSIWSPQAYLKAPNADANDIFGTSTSISGDTIVVGANYEDSNQTTITNGTTGSADNSKASSGAAYVFRRTNSVWAQEAYLKASNADSPDQFGDSGSVAISGDTIVVGANQESSNQTTITNGTTASADNSKMNSGAAYVFKRTVSEWQQEAYLKAPNTDASDYFGRVISLSGDTIVVAAYVEDSNQTTITNGVTASADNIRSGSGAAYVFKRSSSTWAQEAYLKAPNADVNDYFGFGLSISGDTLVVSTRDEDSNQTTITNGTTASADNSKTSSGAAYVFRRTGSTWAQEAYLKASNADSNDYFGASSAISGDSIVVGAMWENSNQTTITNGRGASANNSVGSAGAAYVFKRLGSSWAQEAYLKAPNVDVNDFFGFKTSISGDTVVVGAFQESSNQTTITNGQTASADNSALYSGAVYVFRRPEKSATPDITSVTPTQAFCPGSNIVIFGSGFMKDAVASVDGVDCSSTTVQGPNEIICTTPQVTSTEGTALTIRVTNPNGKMDTFLDTSNWVRTTSVNATNSDWIPSGITVTKGKPFSVTATGTASFGVGFPGVGPNGVNSGATYNYCKFTDTVSYYGGALLGKIGKSGTPFLIGTSYAPSSSSVSGELYLISNDPYCASDNSGTYSVTITAPKAFNCDLPDVPVISISQQPTDQTAVGGNASFSVSAFVTQGATLSYQWQVSTDGGNTFSNLSNQTGATLSLSGLTIAQNNFKYRVVLSSSQVSVSGLGLTSATPVTSNNATLTVPPPVTQCYVSARGGTLLPDLVLGTEKYRIHEFKTVGPTNFTIDSSCPSAVEVLIVAGGGGGGRGFKASGGGGGGGVIYNKTQDLPAGSYTITVGSGGPAGAKGNNSVIAGNGVSLVAIGGGRGGDGENCCSNRAGGDGGSGGGVGQRSGSGAIGNGTPGQGFRGGDARGGNWIAGGGGGGAGGAGQNGWGAGDTVGGNGGAGKQVDIYGERNPNGSIKYTYFAGGGGGQSESYGSAGKWPGVGGTGGGGLGNGTAGTANKGGGGGGGSGPGGSGIVVIRYRIAP